MAKKKATAELVELEMWNKKAQFLGRWYRTGETAFFDKEEAELRLERESRIWRVPLAKKEGDE